jgi:hypothetical protein
MAYESRLDVVLRLRMSGAIPTFPHAVVVCTGTVFLSRLFPLRKATVRFVMSISMKQIVSHWTDFHALSSSKPIFNALLVPITVHECTAGTLKGALDVDNINVMRGVHNVNDFYEICYFLSCF